MLNVSIGTSYLIFSDAGAVKYIICHAKVSIIFAEKARISEVSCEHVSSKVVKIAPKARLGAKAHKALALGLFLTRGAQHA